MASVLTATVKNETHLASIALINPLRIAFSKTMLRFATMQGMAHAHLICKSAVYRAQQKEKKGTEYCSVNQTS